jgi:hypothetical protein
MVNQQQPSLWNNNFKYVPAVQTNIIERWKALGWKVPSSNKPNQFYLK